MKHGRIRFYSRLLRTLCFVGMVGEPLLNVFYWMMGDGFKIHEFKKTNIVFRFTDPHLVSWSDKAPFFKVEAFFIDFIPCIFFVVILFILSKLLKLYENWEFFTKQAVDYIRQIGFVLLLSQLIQPFYLVLRAYILSPASPSVIFLGPLNVKILFLVLFIFLIAHIMEKATQLVEENDLTI